MLHQQHQQWHHQYHQLLGKSTALNVRRLLEDHHHIITASQLLYIPHINVTQLFPHHIDAHTLLL